MCVLHPFCLILCHGISADTDSTKQPNRPIIHMKLQYHYYNNNRWALSPFRFRECVLWCVREEGGGGGTFVLCIIMRFLLLLFRPFHFIFTYSVHNTGVCMKYERNCIYLAQNPHPHILISTIHLQYICTRNIFHTFVSFAHCNWTN